MWCRRIACATWKTDQIKDSNFCLFLFHSSSVYLCALFGCIQWPVEYWKKDRSLDRRKKTHQKLIHMWPGPRLMSSRVYEHARTTHWLQYDNNSWAFLVWRCWCIIASLPCSLWTNGNINEKLKWNNSNSNDSISDFGERQFIYLHFIVAWNAVTGTLLGQCGQFNVVQTTNCSNDEHTHSDSTMDFTFVEKRRVTNGGSKRLGKMSVDFAIRMPAER